MEGRITLPRSPVLFAGALLLAVDAAAAACARAEETADSSRVGSDANSAPGWLGQVETERRDRQTRRYDWPDRQTRWYGWQTLLTDGAVILALVTVPRLDTSRGTVRAVQLASATAYALGAPLIHAGHGRWEKGLLSLGLRSIPFGLAAAAASSGESVLGSSLAQGLLLMMLVSAVLPVVLDPVAFAHEAMPSERGPQLGIAPWIPDAGAGLLVQRAF